MSFPRYPEYKDSGVEWPGEVPRHWDIKRLKHLADIQNGRDYKEVESDEGYPVIGSGGPFSFASRFIYQGESVLLGRKGTIDKPLYVNGAFWAVDTMFYTVVKPRVNAKFLYYCTLTIRFDRYSTNTALPSMTQSDLNNIEFAVPCYEEQCSITAFLEHEVAKLDKLMAEQEKLIALLKEKRQAVISHAVTKGLDPTVPMKDSGVEWLGEVPAHWAVNRLKHLTPQITVGIVVEPSKHYVDEGVPALRSLNVLPGQIKQENFVYISEESNEMLAKSRLYTGDIVAVRSGQTGTAAVVPEKLDGCNCIDLIIIRKPLEGCERFLCWSLASDVALYQFEGGSDGAIQQHFNIGTAMNLVVASPAPEEQVEIADFLDLETTKIDALVRTAEHAIDLLKERRTALISAAVTGQIDVRDLIKEEQEQAA